MWSRWVLSTSASEAATCWLIASWRSNADGGRRSANLEATTTSWSPEITYSRRSAPIGLSSARWRARARRWGPSARDREDNKIAELSTSTMSADSKGAASARSKIRLMRFWITYCAASFTTFEESTTYTAPAESTATYSGLERPVKGSAVGAAAPGASLRTCFFSLSEMYTAPAVSTARPRSLPRFAKGNSVVVVAPAGSLSTRVFDTFLSALAI